MNSHRHGSHRASINLPPEDSMKRERKIVSCALRAAVVLLAFTAMARAESGLFEKRAIFPVNPKHNHASCVVQTKDGSLLAAWYAGSGERKSDDVVIEGAWLPKGKSEW